METEFGNSAKIIMYLCEIELLKSILNGHKQMKAAYPVPKNLSTKMNEMIIDLGIENMSNISIQLDVFADLSKNRLISYCVVHTGVNASEINFNFLQFFRLE